eukprot:scaffold14989_cov113-Isochrysis_galbana.AAC.6
MLYSCGLRTAAGAVQPTKHLLPCAPRRLSAHRACLSRKMRAREARGCQRVAARSRNNRRLQPTTDNAAENRSLQTSFHSLSTSHARPLGRQ